MHLANHINTSLTEIKHCRFDKEKQSEVTLSEDDELTPDWNLFGGDLCGCNQHYGEDELDRLHVAEDEIG
jgi:hypothetical protein